MGNDDDEENFNKENESVEDSGSNDVSCGDYWNYTFNTPHNVGWECPRCGAINAPWIAQCNCNSSYYNIYSFPLSTTSIIYSSS